MRWTNLPVALPSSPWEGLLPDQLGDPEQILLRVSPSAINAAREHLGEYRQEQGGLLLGRLHHHQDNIVAVSVDAIVPAQESIGTEISLSMPASVWTSARQMQTEGQVIVGWYHSHPDIGAFFSATDRKTQAAFFSQVWSVAWVIDPIRREQAWFVGPRSRPLSSTLLQIK
jgi:proteasome lid subunit RPN8/RPN11